MFEQVLNQTRLLVAHGCGFELEKNPAGLFLFIQTTKDKIMDEHGVPFGQASVHLRAGHTSTAGLPLATAVTATSNADGAKRFASAGVRTNPIANSGNYGGSLLTAASSNVFGQFFVGPYNIGNALKTGTISSLSMEAYLGAAVNIVVTGWMINVITSRPSVLDAFGLVSTSAAQVGFGLLFSPAPTTAVKVNAPPSVPQ